VQQDAETQKYVARDQKWELKEATAFKSAGGKVLKNAGEQLSHIHQFIIGCSFFRIN